MPTTLEAALKNVISTTGADASLNSVTYSYADQEVSLPYAVIDVLSYQPEDFKANSDLFDSRVQISVYNDELPELLNIGHTIISNLHRFSDGANIKNIFLNNRGMNYDPETKIHSVILDFQIKYKYI